MAIKFGKREKIIVGVIIGVGAVFGVHTGVFQSRANLREQVTQEYESLKATVQNLPQQRDRAKIEQIRAATDRDLDVLWKTILRMDILFPNYLMPPPGPTPPSDATNETQVAAFTAAIQDWQKAVKMHERVNAAVLAEHIDRLIEMRKAYEAGKSWRGDVLAFGEDKSQGKTMRLDFLGPEWIWLPFLEPWDNVAPSLGGVPVPTPAGGEARGWDVPVDLPQYPLNLREKPVLKDALQRLYDSWNVLTYLSEDSPDYENKRQMWLYQLSTMGLNVDRLVQSETDLGPAIPSIVQLAWAHMIWKQKAPDEVIRFGNVDLTYDMLKSMFAFVLPDPFVVFPFLRAAEALERIVPIARKSGVDNIVCVEIPGGAEKLRTVGLYLENEIVEAKKAGAPAATPRPKGQHLISTIAGTPARAPGAGPTGIASLPAPPPLNQQPGDPQYAILIRMIYVASNEASVRFLYNLVNDPRGFRIDGARVYAGEGNQVWVDLMIDVNLLFTDITALDPNAPGRLTDAATGEPLSEVGRQLYAEHKRRLAELNLDIESVIQKTLAESEIATETMTIPGFTTETLQAAGVAPTAVPAAAEPEATTSTAESAGDRGTN